MASTMPAGWGVVEYHESLARRALGEWDRREDLTDNQVESGLYDARAVAVAETLRALLDELAKDRALRLGS